MKTLLLCTALLLSSCTSINLSCNGDARQNQEQVSKILSDGVVDSKLKANAKVDTTGEDVGTALRAAGGSL